MKERLQKILSAKGIASRRKAEELILAGKVKLNGKKAELGDKASVEDKIEIDGKVIENINNSERIYYIVNKPAGFVSTTEDKHAKKKVVDLVPDGEKMWLVGRLDKESSGLVLLTNDGKLTQEMTHPKFEHKKVYEVEVDKNIDDNFLKGMKKGVWLDEGLAQADEIEKMGDNKFKVVLHQGWKRQIRRMCEGLGMKVVDLKRTQIGKIKLENLVEGEYKKINKKNII